MSVLKALLDIHCDSPMWAPPDAPGCGCHQGPWHSITPPPRCVAHGGSPPGVTVTAKTITLADAPGPEEARALSAPSQLPRLHPDDLAAIANRVVKLIDLERLIGDVSKRTATLLGVVLP